MATTHPIGSVQVASVAQKCLLQSDVATSGSDGSNNWLFEILKNNTTVIFSRQTDAAELPSLDEYDLGAAASAAAANLAANDTLQLRITKAGAPTDISGAEIDATVHINVDIG